VTDLLERPLTPRPFARPDVALLIFCLVFAAFANAAGMIGPVVAAQDRAAAASGVPRFAVENAYLLVVLVLAPLALVVVASFATCRAAGDKEGTVGVAARFASAFVPLGAAMWLAHYGFHLATGAAACAPATARFLNDWGWPAARAENLVRSCCAIEPPQWLLRAEIMALDVGLLATLYLAYRTSTAWHRQRRRATAAFLPWGALAVGLFLLGVWILYQPMEMRGTLPAGSAG